MSVIISPCTKVNFISNANMRNTYFNMTGRIIFLSICLMFKVNKKQDLKYRDIYDKTLKQLVFFFLFQSWKTNKKFVKSSLM